MRFLLVEDEKAVADLLLRALSCDGDETIATPYLTEAVKILEQDKTFDAVLLNLTLPLSPTDHSHVSDGTTYAAIRDVAPEICRVIVSGGTDDKVVRMAGQDGCTYLLKTELDFLTLRDTVQHAIAKYKAFHGARRAIYSA